MPPSRREHSTSFIKRSSKLPATFCGGAASRRKVCRTCSARRSWTRGTFVLLQSTKVPRVQLRRALQVLQTFLLLAAPPQNVAGNFEERLMNDVECSRLLGGINEKGDVSLRVSSYHSLVKTRSVLDC